MVTRASRHLIKGYSLKALGCVGDGTTDDSTALSAALTTASVNGWKIVNDRNDVFYINSAIELEDVPVEMEGGTILYSNSASIALNYTQPLNVRLTDVRLKPEGISNQTALTVYYAASVAVLNRDYNSLVVLKDVEVGDPEDDTGSFLTNIKFENVSRPNLDRLSIHGYRDLSVGAGPEAFRWRAGTIGLHLVGSGGSPVQMDLFNPDFMALETCIKAQGQQEGLYLWGGNLINSKYGLDLDWDGDGGSPVVNPGLGIYGTHMNCAASWLKTSYIYDVNITGCHWYKFPFVDNVNFIGFDCVALDRARIQSNIFDGLNNVTSDGVNTYTIGSVQLGLLENSKRCDFSNNSYRRFDSLWELTTVGSVDNRFTPCLNETGLDLVTYSSSASKASQYTSVDNTNASAVTVTSATINIVPVSIRLREGDEVEVFSEFYLEKGGTAGNTVIQITEGTGDFTWNTGGGAILTRPDFPANEALRECIVSSGVATVTQNYTFYLQAASAGSNSTVPIGEAYLKIKRV